MGGGGAKPFSSWKLNDEHNLTVLVKGGRDFLKLQEGGGEAKYKPETDTPEQGFKLLIAWSLIGIVLLCFSVYGAFLGSFFANCNN